MSTVTENKKRVSKLPAGKGLKQILPALAAVGSACSLVAGPALALELGELTVESKLGQPLRASIAFALQPHEQLHDYCISLKTGPTDSGLPGLSKATISVGDSAIRLTGSIPILEPMLGLQLSVSCPYTPNLQREYAMFFYPNTLAQEPKVQVETAAREPAPASDAIDGRTARSQSKSQAAKDAAGARSQPVDAASRYLVQPGDSLSGIVARISDRPPGLWPAVQAVFEANPQAFINGDINLVKAGSWLTIPDLYLALGQNTVPTVAEQSATAPAPVADIVERYDSSATQPFEQEGTFNSGFEAQPEPAADAILKASAPTSESAGTKANAVARPVAGELQPGDVLSVVSQGEDGQHDSTGDSAGRDTAATVPTVTVPDTSVANTAVPVRTTKSQPATEDLSGVASRSWSWLVWLGGAGVAVFLGLLLFGRHIREKYGSTSIGDAPAAAPQRRHADPERRAAVPAEVDFDFDSVSSDVSSLSLDADLGLGTGLRGSSDIDVAQDFGFSARHDFAQEIDLELPPVTEDEPEQHTTDIIPPHRMTEPSILESEIPPSDDDDEYDLSMIVDATRQPIVDAHLTAKDLKAVPVGIADDDDESAEYTLSREIDYKILEQDYQEEFTTTQALNEEIARAAIELAHTMSGNISSDQTSELPRNRKASILGTDRTAEMPGRAELEITAELTGKLMTDGAAVNDDLISDLDDTGVNEVLTAESPHGEHDVTAELAVEGGRVDTKKSRVETKKSRVNTKKSRLS